MPVIALSLKHGQTPEEARAGLANAVSKIQGSFGALVQRTEWQTGGERVKLVGTGFEIEMHVDATDIHITGEIPLLAKLLGDKLLTNVKTIVQDTFQKRLTR